MDDCNLMAADCMVLSCCSCQCLLLQFLIFLFLKLPRRIKEYAMRTIKMVDAAELARNGSETYAQMYNREESMCIDINGGIDDQEYSNDLEDPGGKKDCIEEIERVLLEEYYAKGEFGFGSFWRKEVMFQMTSTSRPSHSSSSSSLQSCTANMKKGMGLETVQFGLIEIVHSLSFSSYGPCKDINQSYPSIWRDLRRDELCGF